MGACTKGQHLSVQRIVNDRPDRSCQPSCFVCSPAVAMWLHLVGFKKSSARWLQLHERELQILGVREAWVAIEIAIESAFICLPIVSVPQ